MSDTLLAFKAGRAIRREGTNTVEADPAKGAISLTTGEDELLHFIWKNRTTGVVEEDLILFPTEATFSKVAQSNGRVYVLKFSSSNQRHFFWMQDASSARDEEFARNVNGLLQDSDYELQWSADGAESSTQGAQPQASTSTSGGSNQASSDQLATLQNLLRSGGTGAAAAAAATAAGQPEISLVDVLTPANITPLFSSHPELIPSLFPHLPPDLPVPPSADALQRIIHSPQFRSAVANLDQALRTGLLGEFVRQLGLPAEAGLGVVPFLRAIQEQANQESGNQMDTD
ncbi:adhesion regulating molecule [Coprinopsis marcescibilis]|uniref:Adhesion regulating molecule n=1 Tax=Coprinopsis marcescibilis TaxID=230819 RepID=A0A5C3L5E3_COPMA|nr:adhesion regulating molecule [Coprinopsis marcescibilis]